MSTTPGPDAQLNLRHYLRVLERRKWVIIGTTLLITVLTLASSLTESKVYQSGAEVVMDRQDLASALTGTPNQSLAEDPSRFLATQAAVARSRAVAELAVKSAGVPDRSPGTLLANSSVNPNPNADVLNFTVSDPNPANATALANAYAAAYAETKLKFDTQTLQEARNELSARISHLRSTGDQQTSLYRSLVSNDEELHTMQLLQTKAIVFPGTGLGAQVKPTPKHDALLGFALGLIVGIAAAFLLDALDTKVRSESEIEHELGLPLLARIPDPRRRLRHDSLTMIDDPTGPDADAVRRLASNVEFSAPDNPAQILMVTSAVQREGKSTTAANLAVALARSGRSVALVDLDLRQPTIASLFSIRRLVGLTNVVMQQAELVTALVHIPLSGNESAPVDTAGRTSAPSGQLFILPSGALPVNPGEFVAAQAVVKRILEPLRKKFEYVIVDAPPMGIGGDAVTLAGRVDLLILIAKLGVIDRAALSDLRRELSKIPTPTLGFVLTGVDPASRFDYGMYTTSRDEPSVVLQPPAEDGGERQVRARA